MILLDNAVKYTNKNGSITLTMYQHRKKIILVINNTGRGIAGEQIDKIFDRFYRIDQSRSRENEGYGLGLAIAKTIVDHHGGQIYAESNLNEKTTFTVELPISENK